MTDHSDIRRPMGPQRASREAAGGDARAASAPERWTDSYPRDEVLGVI
jgi:hypothetical protein